MLKLLLGTRNRGKTEELRELFLGLPINLVDLSLFGDIDEPVEDGLSFEANAEIKARAYAVAAGCITVADDSGLEVAALGGQPGIFSARYAGIGATDEQNNAKLSEELKNSESHDKSAKFVCSICLSDPDGKVLFQNTSYCEGKIADNPRGINGFGYDPLFIPNGFSETFGELKDEQKRLISHRSKASAKLAEFLASNMGLLT